MSTRVLVVVILSSLLADGLRADPRWWTHDRAITRGDRPKTKPNVAIASAAMGGGAGGDALFVVWEEPSDLGGDLNVWLNASFDGGCNWCEPRPWAVSAGDDTAPQVPGRSAYGVMHGSTMKRR